MLYVFIKAWRNTYNLLITYYSMDFVDYYYVVYDLLHKKTAAEFTKSKAILGLGFLFLYYTLQF